MVLCKHFQQGNCRFGSKCNFDHIDIKQIVKNDMDAALNGKQFPISCYGPFKDKPNIPNFIEDQSFEEIRLLCYEAKQKNCFEQFHQQFHQGVMDATNKMKALLQPNYEIMNILTMIYDTPVEASKTTNGNNMTSGNNFGFNANTESSAGSIFGKSALPNTQQGSNIFGSASLFGGGGNNNNNNNGMQQSSSIFGGQNAFNTQQQPQQQTSIFGQPAQQQQQQQQSSLGNSIFGGGGGAGITKPSIFGQTQPMTQNSGSGFGLFSQAAQQTAPIFNQQSGFGQAQPQQQQVQQQMQPAQQGGGIFGQSSFGSQPANVNPFAQAQQTTQNLFAQAAAATVQQVPPQQQQANTMGANIFAQAVQQTNSTMTPAGGFFQQQQQQPQMAMDNMQQTVQQPQLPMMQQPFSQQPPPQQQQQQFMTQNPLALPNSIPSSAPDSVYSRLEDLSQADIEAFKADFFEPGKLPISPPSIELLY